MSVSVVRPYLIVLVGQAAISPWTGFAASAWSFAGILLVAMLFWLTDSIDSDSAGFALALVIGRIAVIAVVAVVLFFSFGWLTCLVFVLLVVTFFATKETVGDQWHRQADEVRVSLVRLVAAKADGQITDDQLAARAQKALTDTLPRQAFFIKSVAERLTRADSLPPAQHRLLLDQLRRHAERVNPHGSYPHSPHTALEDAIRAAGGH